MGVSDRCLPTLLLSLLIALTASCGGDGDTAADDRPRFTSEEIAARFRDATGEELPPGKMIDLEHLGGGRSVLFSSHDRLEAKYGEFAFVVRKRG